MKCDWPSATRSCSIDISFAVLQANRRILARFDDNIYFGMGNDIRFGLISILGGEAKQAVISQDVPRTGGQWLVTLSRRPRVILSGPKWEVGRQGDDMRIIDLDGDGVYEITVPITDFYVLQDKMSISQIPLPEIIFRYDRSKRTYLPANPVFQDYALHGMTTSTEISMVDELQHRSIVLGTTLTLIYAGNKKDGWQYFDQSYKLEDKEAIRRRVQAILVKQPVYKFIYNHKKRR